MLNAVSVSNAPTAANTKKTAGNATPNATATTSSAISASVRARDRGGATRLGADDLAVELGEPDGDRRRDQRTRHHAGPRRVLLEYDQERQADDRAVDDARDLARSQMGCERSLQLRRSRPGRPAPPRAAPRSRRRATDWMTSPPYCEIRGRTLSGRALAHEHDQRGAALLEAARRGVFMNLSSTPTSVSAPAAAPVAAPIAMPNSGDEEDQADQAAPQRAAGGADAGGAAGLVQLDLAVGPCVRRRPCRRARSTAPSSAGGARRRRSVRCRRRGMRLRSGCS